MLYWVTKSDGTLVDVTDDPRFVKVGKYGAYVACSYGEATHIALGDGVYKLREEVSVRQQSLADYVKENEARSDYVLMMNGIDYDVELEDEAKEEAEND